MAEKSKFTKPVDEAVFYVAMAGLMIGWFTAAIMALASAISFLRWSLRRR